MILHLLRHGETDWNRLHRLQGLRDVPLNRAGVHQSRKLAQRFRTLRSAVIFTSPLARAGDTAIEIRKTTNWPLVVDDRLREIDHGHWTAMTAADIATAYPRENIAWRTEPESFSPSSGETLRTVYRRSTNFLSALLRSCSACNVLIVSHGVVNALLLCALLGAPIGRVWEFPQPNGAIYGIRLRRRTPQNVEYLDHV